MTTDDIPADAHPPLEPGIYLVGTPIGNREDITLRALRVLANAEVLACEDTRVTRKLFQRYGIAPPKTLLACNDHNERTVARRLAAEAAEGRVAAFCSDAGMPGISDPGFNIVRAAREAGVRTVAIPGPSAVTTAAALSGLAGGGFTFLGFPPRRDGRVRALLERYGRGSAALLFYESPRRLGRLLRLAEEVLGPEREAAVCLELTKKFERLVLGSLDELARAAAGREERGEAVVVIAAAPERGDRAAPGASGMDFP
ncbi:MAG: 16S rRNA (cytidine(1402)-2'-O)-methyltransferase [Planctomycetota bacterium]|jgi:16S rRNA (cytidine1402-2'-O)-methyltransferase|nr:16S rRNA (cytidine(1402)-2'-O)-methyltransferase [Planctomycetota bacterium]